MKLFIKKASRPFVVLIFVGKKIIVAAALNEPYLVPCSAFIQIETPCSAEDLGNSVIAIMKQVPQCRTADSQPALLFGLTGIRSLRRLVKEYHLLNLSWPVEGRLSFQLFAGDADGAYCPTSIHKTLPLTANSSEIGRCIFELIRSQHTHSSERHFIVGQHLKSLLPPNTTVSDKKTVVFGFRPLLKPTTVLLHNPPKNWNNKRKRRAYLCSNTKKSCSIPLPWKSRIPSMPRCCRNSWAAPTAS